MARNLLPTVPPQRCGATELAHYNRAALEIFRAQALTCEGCGESFPPTAVAAFEGHLRTCDGQSHAAVAMREKQEHKREREVAERDLAMRLRQLEQVPRVGSVRVARVRAGIAAPTLTPPPGPKIIIIIQKCAEC